VASNEYYVPLAAGAPPLELAGGRSAAPGEVVKLSADEVKKNKELIESEQLLPIEKGGEK
jgi:hypothetical protein